MSLPSIVMPESLPMWRLGAHAVQYGDPYATITFATGRARRRRVTTGAEHTFTGELPLLTQAQMSDLHLWYEADLLAGAELFAARIMGEDGQPEWWAARFAEPPRIEPVASSAGARWRVSVTLRLSGTGSASGPA